MLPRLRNRCVNRSSPYFSMNATSFFQARFVVNPLQHREPQRAAMREPTGEQRLGELLQASDERLGASGPRSPRASAGQVLRGGDQALDDRPVADFEQLVEFGHRAGADRMVRSICRATSNQLARFDPQPQPRQPGQQVLHARAAARGRRRSRRARPLWPAAHRAAAARSSSFAERRRRLRGPCRARACSSAAKTSTICRCSSSLPGASWRRLAAERPSTAADSSRPASAVSTLVLMMRSSSDSFIIRRRSYSTSES